MFNSRKVKYNGDAIMLRKHMTDSNTYCKIMLVIVNRKIYAILKLSVSHLFPCADGGSFRVLRFIVVVRRERIRVESRKIMSFIMCRSRNLTVDIAVETMLY